MADIDDGTLLIADIPGIIEGASQGKGLGDAFLRHIERTGVLLHLIDVYSDDIAAGYQTIRNELAQYSPELAERPEVIALTKCEGLDEDIVDMQRQAVCDVAGDTPVYAISSQAHRGITDVLRTLRRAVQQSAQAVETTDRTSWTIRFRLSLSMMWTPKPSGKLKRSRVAIWCAVIKLRNLPAGQTLINSKASIACVTS